MLEEYNYTLKYIEEKNINADILSRYPMIDVDRSSIEEMVVVEIEAPCVLDFKRLTMI